MVRPIVEYIASRTEEHASVGVVDEDELVYIARSRHTPFNSTSVRLGERVPIFCTAGGRLWLASLPEAECETVLQIGMLVLAVPLTDREGTWWGALSLTSHQSRTSLEALCRDHLDLLYSAQAMLVG